MALFLRNFLVIWPLLGKRFLSTGVPFGGFRTSSRTPNRVGPSSFSKLSSSTEDDGACGPGHVGASLSLSGFAPGQLLSSPTTLVIKMITVRVKIITGSLVTLENLFPQNYRCRYSLEIRMGSFNYHYRYRLGVRSHLFISIDSQLPS